MRGATLKEGAPFELVSRESGLVINNLLLSVILGIVFLGTLYPLFVEAVSGEKLSVGAPTSTLLRALGIWLWRCWSDWASCLAGVMNVALFSNN